MYMHVHACKRVHKQCVHSECLKKETCLKHHRSSTMFSAHEKRDDENKEKQMSYA